MVTIETLLQQIACHKSLNELTESCSEYMNNPVMILDHLLNLLYASDDESICDPTWRAHMAGMTKEAEIAPPISRLMSEVIHSNSIVTLPDDSGLQQRMVARILSGEITRGYIVCLEQWSSFNDQSEARFNIIRNLLAIELGNMHLSGASVEKQIHTIMQELIFSSDRKKYSTIFLTSLFGAGSDPYRVMTVLLNGPQINDHQVEYLRVQLSWISRQIFTVTHENEIVILLPANVRKLPGIINKAETILTSYHVHSGVSNAFNDLTDMNYYYRQAKHSALTAASMSAQTTFFFKDILLSDLLRVAGRDTDLSFYIHSDIRALQEHDRDYHTDYLKTLYFVLQKAGNITAAAAGLHTHRNTVVHRLNQMKQLMSSDLGSGEDQAILWIGLCILRNTGTFPLS